MTVDKTILMEKLLLGVHVDLAKHIFDVIDVVVGTPFGGGGLPFGGLIMWFLLK